MVMAISVIALRCARVLVAATAMLAMPAAFAQTLTPVRVGITNSASDVSLFIAHKRGYFRDAGLDVTFEKFDSAARMIAPFVSGDLDVGTGAVSAAFYNAVGRGIDVRIVADKNSTPPGRGTQPLLVRKDLVDSGRFKTLADLKGMKIAGAAPGTSSMATINRALEKGGLAPEDIEMVSLGFPQHVIALANKAIDASFTVEPSASEAIRMGLAVRIMGDDEVYPDHQLSVTQYSGQFAKTKPVAARKFLEALLRGVRDFNESLVDGRYAGAKGDAVAAILAEYGPFRDAAIYKSFNTSYSDPDGKLNMDSLRTDLEVFRKAGLIEAPVTVGKSVDTAFLDAALKELGPYQASKRD
jgi:NitT/TauT family transport system substrate-binding protein